MFNFLTDASIIFISLALFGFLVKDAFYWGRIIKPPNLYRSNIQAVFHFTSVATFILCLFIVFFVITAAAPNQENFITQFANSLLELVQSYESNESIPQGTLSSIINFLTLAFFPSLFYLGAYLIISNLGLISCCLNVNWVKIYFKDDQAGVFPRIIAEDDYFLYVEDEMSNQYWKAFRRSDIQKIEVVQHPSKGAFLMAHYSELMREGKYRELLFEIIETFWILIFTLVLIVPIILS